MVRLLLLLFFIAFTHHTAFSQGEYKHWYFGIGDGISFTDTGIRVIKNSRAYTIESAVSMSDSDGNLLFYGGRNIYDRNHNRMPSDTNIKYDGTTEQSFLVIPKPGDPNIYYYLLNSCDYVFGGKRQIRIHTIDMRANGGLGDIVAKEDTLMWNSTEQLTGTRHRNGKDFWIVTHSFATNEFYSFLVTKNGINKTPVISATGINPNNFATRYAGNVKISDNGCWLAATIREAWQGGGALQLLRFNNLTGKVSGNDYINVYAPWGIEFSPCSKYLYLGFNTMKPLIQYDLSGSNPASILANGQVCSDTLTSWDIQTGPDGKLYFCGVHKTFRGSFVKHIGVIESPNKKGLACNAYINFQDTFNNIKCGLPNNMNLHSTNYKNCSVCYSLVKTQSSQTICYNDSVKFNKKYLKTPGTYYSDTIRGLCCDTLKTLQLSVRAKPESDTTYSLCAGDSLALFDSIMKTAGIYVLHTKTLTGCDSTITVQISALPKADTTIYKSLCAGDSLLMLDSTMKMTGTYILHTQSNTGCDSTVTVKLTVFPKADTTINRSVCAGDSLVIFDSTMRKTGTYVFHTKTLAGCDSTVTVKLSVWPKADTSISRTLCAGDSLIVNGNTMRQSGTYIFHTKTARSCDSMITVKLLVLPKADTTISRSVCAGDSIVMFDSTVYKAGKYVFKRKTAAGCDSIITLQASFLPKPVMPELSDTSICEGDSLAFDFSSYHYKSISWNGILLDTRFFLGIHPKHVLSVTDSNTCSNSDSFAIISKDCDTVSTSLKIPNIFTVGHDGYNDCFDIGIEGETYYSLLIYNRWGTLVYRQDSDAEDVLGNNWNGSLFNTGPDCPSGTYYYLFDYAFPGKKQERVNGIVQLMR